MLFEYGIGTKWLELLKEIAPEVASSADRAASLFRPENGSYKLLARLQMSEWPRIAAAAN